MNGYRHRKIRSVIVHIKGKQLGAVLVQRFNCVGEARVPALDKPQFFEEIAYSSIAVNSRADIVVRYAFIGYAPVKAGIGSFI